MSARFARLKVHPLDITRGEILTMLDLVEHQANLISLLRDAIVDLPPLTISKQFGTAIERETETVTRKWRMVR